MVESDREFAGGVSEEGANPEFDRLMGVITDGFIGAIGGFAGTTVLTVVLLVASTFGAFDLESFATLAEITGLGGLFPTNAAAVGYFIFLVEGMVTWPLLFVSIGSYLPDDRYAVKGLAYGVVLWTGFVFAFYGSGSLLLYLALTLVGHLGYGFTLGAVFDYLSSRPTTLV